MEEVGFKSVGEQSLVFDNITTFAFSMYYWRSTLLANSLGEEYRTLSHVQQAGKKCYQHGERGHVGKT